MSHQATITKQDLLAMNDIKAAIASVYSANGEEIAVATARALGFTVTEEPALPERLRLHHNNSVTIYADPMLPSDNLVASSPHPHLARELVRRYNAKDAVLALATQIEGSFHSGTPWMIEEIPRRLRAAYAEAPAP